MERQRRQVPWRERIAEKWDLAFTEGAERVLNRNDLILEGMDVVPAISFSDEQARTASLISREALPSWLSDKAIGFLQKLLGGDEEGNLDLRKTTALFKMAKQMGGPILSVFAAISERREEPITEIIERSWERFVLSREVLRFPKDRFGDISSLMEDYFDGIILMFDPASEIRTILGEIKENPEHKYRSYFEDLSLLELIDILIMRSYLLEEEKRQSLPFTHPLMDRGYSEEGGGEDNLERLHQRAEKYGFPFNYREMEINPEMPLKLLASKMLNEANFMDEETRWYWLNDVLAAWARVEGLLAQGSEVWVGMGRVTDQTHASLQEYIDRWGADNLVDTGRLIRGIRSFEDFIFMVLPTAVRLLKDQKKAGIDEPIAIKVFPQDEKRNIAMGGLVLAHQLTDTFLEKRRDDNVGVIWNWLTSSFVTLHRKHSRGESLAGVSNEDLENAYLYYQYFRLQEKENQEQKEGGEEQITAVEKQFFLQMEKVRNAGGNVFIADNKGSVFVYDLPKGLTMRDRERTSLSFSFDRGWELIQVDNGFSRKAISRQRAMEILIEIGLLEQLKEEEEGGKVGREIDSRFLSLLGIIEENVGRRGVVNVELMTRIGDLEADQQRLAFAIDVVLGGKEIPQRASYKKLMEAVIGWNDPGIVRARLADLKSYFNDDLSNPKKMRQVLERHFQEQKEQIMVLRNAGKLTS